MEKKQKQIGVVSNFFERISVASIKLTAGLKVGDKVKIVGGEVELEQEIESMQIHGKEVKSAKKGEEIGTKVSEKVRQGYRVFKA